MPDLSQTVAVVTGASKGIGKGIAEGLGEYGATVYLTGRSSSDAPGALSVENTARSVEALGGTAIPVALDHNNDDQVQALFERVSREQGRLDILVNNVYQIPSPPAFSGGFWEHPIKIWDDQCGVGLRGYYTASVYAAPLLIRQPGGLIVNISSRGGRGYVFNTAYGVGKAGVDRMAKDMAHELRPHGVAAISLSPSKVKTEFILEQISRGELPPLDPAVAQSVRLSGRVIAAVASAQDRMEISGGAYTVAEFAERYAVVDPDRE